MAWTARLKLLFACWLMGLALATPAQASHSSPPFYIDDDSPPEEDFDGDYHFHSIRAALEQFPHPQEGDALFIAPGVYEGDLLLQVEGLSLQAIGPAEQTIVVGRIVVAAKRVTLVNLTVDGTGRASGVSILDDKAVLKGSSVFGADVGVSLGEGAPVRDIVLQGNRLYHNGVGVRGKDLGHTVLRDNMVEANAGSGAVLEGVDHLTLSDNVWVSNGEAGLSLENGRDVHLEREQALHNAGHGMALSDVQRATLDQVTCSENGEAGVQFNDAVDNAISGSRFERNGAAGVKLEGRSQDNAIADSQFRGHSDEAAAGLWLAGQAYDNQVRDNELVENRVGIRFSQVHGEAPAGNQVEGNRIEGSSGEGIRIEASAGDNLFINNQLLGNNAHGAYVAGKNDRWQDNRIQQSGGSAVVLDGARNVVVEANELSDNQEHGIELRTGAQNNVLLSNVVQGNDQSGISLENSPNNRVQDNTIQDNQRHGVAIAASSDLRVSGNRIQRNGALGLWLDSAVDVEVRGNVITENNLGGVGVEQSGAVDVEANAIVANLHVGLRARQSEVLARRNWWGDALGPAGFFEGRGNAVTGVELDRVLPWLPAEPERVELASVSAALLDSVGSGEVLEFDWSDRAQLTWQLSEVGRDGERFSLAAVLMSRTREPVLAGAQPLPGALALYGLQVSGFSGGSSQLTVSYSELPADVDPKALRLWWWEGDRWVALPGFARPALHQVSGEVETARLKPGWIALAPVLDPSVLAGFPAAVTGVGREGFFVDAARVRTLGEGFELLGLAWGALGAWRLARRLRAQRLRANSSRSNSDWNIA